MDPSITLAGVRREVAEGMARGAEMRRHLAYLAPDMSEDEVLRSVTQIQLFESRLQYEALQVEQNMVMAEVEIEAVQFESNHRTDAYLRLEDEYPGLIEEFLIRGLTLPDVTNRMRRHFEPGPDRLLDRYAEIRAAILRYLLAACTAADGGDIDARDQALTNARRNLDVFKNELRSLQEIKIQWLDMFALLDAEDAEFQRQMRQMHQGRYPEYSSSSSPPL